MDGRAAHTAGILPVMAASTRAETFPERRELALQPWGYSSSPAACFEALARRRVHWIAGYISALILTKAARSSAGSRAPATSDWGDYLSGRPHTPYDTPGSQAATRFREAPTDGTSSSAASTSASKRTYHDLPRGGLSLLQPKANSPNRPRASLPHLLRELRGGIPS